jgi:hypothetical protein
MAAPALTTETRRAHELGPSMFREAFRLNFYPPE